jgi:uncharacterized protein (TIGR04222 family)
MNPFDLPGPQFLLLYLILAVAVLTMLWQAIAAGEIGPPPPLPLSDPYQIAWLRGGTPEAARVAVLSLTDRGLLTLTGTMIEADAGRPVFGLPPIERVILASCAGTAIPATAVLSDAAVAAACEPYRTQFEATGLMPSAAMRARRRRLLAIAVAVLLGVAVVKIVVAIERGRHNIAFLVMLTLLAGGAALFAVGRRHTALGRRMLRDLRTLFAALRQRAATIRPGAMTSDAMLLAAVFGLGALPASGFAALRAVYRKAANSSGSGCGTSCGSGCGGGGGGGCGGCGSG